MRQGTPEFARYGCTEEVAEGATCAVLREPVLSNLPIKRLKRITWMKGRNGSPLTKDSSQKRTGLPSGSSEESYRKGITPGNAGRIVPIQTTGECCWTGQGWRVNLAQVVRAEAPVSL